MKYFFLFILILFKINNALSDDKIAFIDLNYIMNNSLSGKSINSFIKDLNKTKLEEFKKIENNLKKDENDLIAKKNIIEKNLYNEKVKAIKIRINNYKLDRQNFEKTLEKKKIVYTNKLLEKLNPIISNYVEKNSISVVFPKKMIIVGKKNLDITIPILNMLDKSIQKINFNE